jgi:hypothetical protein
MPDDWISCVVAALKTISTIGGSDLKKPYICKVCNIGKEIEDGTDAESKWPCDCQRANRISDVVHNIVNVGPSGVGIENFEGCGSILSQ